MAAWSIEKSLELYGIPEWGAGLFGINQEGNLVIKPTGTEQAIDLKSLINEIIERGIDPPLLLRFPDVLERRMAKLAGVFEEVFTEYDYKGRYRGVFPIKVNQERHMLETYLGFAVKHHMGLEVGSKPELLVALALLDDSEALLICNGYKDAGYIEAALLSHLLGRQTVLVIEKKSEVETIIEVSRRLKIRPRLGIRAKLSRRSSGRWSHSSGDLSKFGLSPHDILWVVDRLKEEDLLDCLNLLHFHIGSQINAIRVFKEALREATRMYVELFRLGAPMGLFDVGGGLGVDYDGSRTSRTSSINYNEREYASDVVSAIKSACEKADIDHPDIVTESGRALATHHTVLVFDVLGAEGPPLDAQDPEIKDDDHELLVEMRDLLALLRTGKGHLQEAWNDALQWREQGLQSFNLGLIDLKQRAALEVLFWKAMAIIHETVRDQPYIPQDMKALERLLARNSYCNLSLFQSLPDSWSIGQRFPIVPIQRLDEQPMDRTILVDLTCDSDGRIDHFINRYEEKDALEIHALTPGERYFLAVPFVGAYQEVLGALHTLFGDTNAVHITISPEGPKIDRILEGDSVVEVLNYVLYSRKMLVVRLREACEANIRAQRITPALAKRLMRTFSDTLDGYTYLQHHL